MRRSQWPQSLAKMGRGAFATLPTEELPGLRVGFGGSAAGPTVYLLRPPCSTLPDSPPDSGSEAYSPQQVNGESSGQRQPPPLGLGKWLVQPYQGEREEGGRGPVAAQRVRLSLVKYSSALAIVPPWAGGKPGPASEQVSLLAMPPSGPPRHHGRALWR